MMMNKKKETEVTEWVMSVGVFTELRSRLRRLTNVVVEKYVDKKKRKRAEKKCIDW